MTGAKIERSTAVAAADTGTTARQKSAGALGVTQLVCAGLSHPGRVRRTNEDGLLLLPAAGLFAVADGLGGLDAGDIASRTALQAMAALYQTPQGSACLSCFFPAPHTPPGQPPLAELIGAVNLCSYRQKIALGRNMATTLALVQLYESTAVVAHVGDSRVYQWRAGQFTPLTRDYSLVNKLCDQGTMTSRQAEHSRQRHVITRALGAAAQVRPTVASFRVTGGDLLLLCTDGLTAMLSDAEIRAILLDGTDDLGWTVERLVVAANEAGGRDNVTVGLVKLVG